MKRFAKFLIKLLVVVIVICILGAITVNLSPRPMAWFIKKIFATTNNATPPGYDQTRQKVLAEKDIEYPSRFPSNRLDVFSSNQVNGKAPTILWVHGGAFVGGDKADIETWSTVFASEGFTVVSINYALAPDNNYPTPLLQLNEVYTFLKANESRFPKIDLQRLIIGGDSAGAQIASQFVTLQTNPELAKSMQMDPAIPREQLLGVILYCGPYDLKGLHDSGTTLGKFFIRQMGWAYFGVRNWSETPQAVQATTPNHVTSNFPPTFITDGNTASFEHDARQLEQRLKDNNVRVESLYYSLERAKLGHEYQFNFALPEAIECKERTLSFLRAITQPE
jgi:acetyl esterase/lipase